MKDEYALVGIITFLLFVIIDNILIGFASATRDANVSELTKRAENGEIKAQRILHMLDQHVKLNITVQIITMVLNIVTGVFLLSILSGYFEGIYAGNVLAVVLVILFIAIFGIAIPVRIAKLNPDKVINRYFGLVRIILIVLHPVTFVINFAGNCLLRLIGINPYTGNDNVTEEEIMTMVNEGHEQGIIEADEAEMISNIFEFGDKEAVDIMTHRKNIIALDGNMTLEEAVTFMLHENNSRYPVYDGDIDNIIGIVHVKDALKEYGNRAKAEECIKNIGEILYEAKLIPCTRNINDLFKLMQREKVHMAIVVDEYGQTAGLVTMEDILEEIVGNILDEHDEDEEQIMLRADNTYVVDGLTTLEDLEEELGITFDMEEDINTLNGFLVLKIGKIPNESYVGTEIEYNGYKFKIQQVEGRVISSVSITKIVDEPAQKSVDE